MKSPSKRQHQAEAETKKKQKSTDTKGKGRAVEIDLDDSDDGGATRANKRRTTGSQLKAGWKLQPLSLQPLEGNTLPARVSSRKSSTRRPSQSPVKRSASKQTTTSSSSKQQRTTPAAVTIPPISTSTAIEILSDDDEDDEIQEITSLAVAAEGPRASTSSSKSKPLRVPSPVRAPQLASTLKATITLDTPSQESDVTATLPITTTTTPSLDSVAVVGNDIDLEEDLEFLYPSTSRDALRQHGEQRAVITFDDDDIVGEDEGEVWEDNERMTMRRSDSEAGSMLDEPYYDFENGINEDAGSRAPSNAGDFAEMLDGQDPDSDDDILQVSLTLVLQFRCAQERFWWRSHNSLIPHVANLAAHGRYRQRGCRTQRAKVASRRRKEQFQGHAATLVFLVAVSQYFQDHSGLAAKRIYSPDAGQQHRQKVGGRSRKRKGGGE